MKKLEVSYLRSLRNSIPSLPTSFYGVVYFGVFELCLFPLSVLINQSCESSNNNTKKGVFIVEIAILIFKFMIP